MWHMWESQGRVGAWQLAVLYTRTHTRTRQRDEDIHIRGSQVANAPSCPATPETRAARDTRAFYEEATPFLRMRKNSSSLMKPSLSRSAAVIISPISSSVIVSPSSRATDCDTHTETKVGEGERSASALARRRLHGTKACDASRSPAGWQRRCAPGGRGRTVGRPAWRPPWCPAPTS